MSHDPAAPRPCHTTRIALMAVLLASTALGGFSVGHSGRAAGTEPALNTPAVAQAIPDFADLVARVKPAVVSITVMGREVADDDAPRPFGRMPRDGRGGEGRRSEGRGSGFIIDAAGTIVTNNHVVRGATSVSVTLDDGTVLPAKVVGRDGRTDIAVLKIVADRSLPFVKLGASANVRPGEWVVAMGNPFGLGGSVSAGIVSAAGRDIGAGPYDQFIQIDAPINPGNSGGPLFAQDGRVVGVNTAIYSPSGGSVGIGFAVPADVVRNVVAQLEHDGRVTRGYIGVQTQPVEPALVKALHLPGTGGALVANVVADSPAAKAGLQPGDVVRAVGGQKIETPRDLAVAIAGVKPGENARLDILRNGAASAIEVVVTNMPNEQRADADTVAPAADAEPRVGLALAPLSPDVEGKLDLPKGTQGVVIAAVAPGSAAARAGLRAGDVITRVGIDPVASPEEATRAIRAGSHAEALALRILRDGNALFVAVRLGAGGAGLG